MAVRLNGKRIENLLARSLEGSLKVIVVTLSWLIAIVVFVSTLGLIYSLASDLIYPPEGLQVDELFDFFGYILLVFIGVELLETFKNYDLKKTINILVVFLVAMTAMVRSVIIMGLEGNSDGWKLLGMSAIIISLSVGYYLIKKAESTE